MDRAGIYNRVSDVANDRSPEQQGTEADRAARENGWRVAGSWADQLSASRYASAARKQWPEFVERVRRGSFDVVILWESSRGGRELEDWAGFLNACRRTSTRIYITARERMYDLANSEDYRTLALDGIDSVYESEKTSRRSRRGIADSVARGEPTGRIPYGYRRTYTREPGRTKPVARQEPDPNEAPIVREIIGRVARDEAVSAILRDFAERGVATRAGGAWSRSSVNRLILGGVVYIGKRRHNGAPLVDGNWPPLVDEETYWRAVAVLSNPARKAQADRRGGIRPGKARWLLSYVSSCGVCGGLLSVKYLRRSGGPVAHYRCYAGCVSAPVSWLDEMATVAVVRWCSESPLYEMLTRAGNQEAQAARDEAQAERDRLAEFEEQAISGKLGPDSFARIAAGIEKRINELEARARELSAPPALRGLVSDKASPEERWEDINSRWNGMPLTAQRSVISTIFAPVLYPANGNPADRNRFQMPLNPGIMRQV